MIHKNAIAGRRGFKQMKILHNEYFMDTVQFTRVVNNKHNFFLNIEHQSRKTIKLLNDGHIEQIRGRWLVIIMKILNARNRN